MLQAFGGNDHMADSSYSPVRGGSFVGRAIAVGFVVLGLLCCGAIVRPTVATVAGEMVEIVTGVFILAVGSVGHAITTWWGWRRRVHWTRWVMTQVPYLVIYVMLYVWFVVGWSMEERSAVAVVPSMGRFGRRGHELAVGVVAGLRRAAKRQAGHRFSQHSRRHGRR